MSAKSGRDGLVRGSCARVLLIVSGLIGATAGPAQGSPLRHTHHAQTVNTETLNSVQAYFLHALETHARHVVVPAQLRELQATNGLLPQTPFVQYLEWRWSLDPSRFDRFHPHMGPMLAIDHKIRQSLAVTPTETQPNPVIPPTVTTQPQTIGPPTTPSCSPPPVNGAEPSTALLGLVMAGAAAWARRRRRAVG